MAGGVQQQSVAPDAQVFHITNRTPPRDELAAASEQQSGELFAREVRVAPGEAGRVEAVAVWLGDQPIGEEVVVLLGARAIRG